jgi:hypothetical protein
MTQVIETVVGCAMAQVVSRLFVTATAWVSARLGPCGICGVQSDIGIAFSQSYLVFPVYIVPPQFFMLIYHLADEQ